MFGKETVRLLSSEDSNIGSIFNANAETDAQEEGKDTMKKDKKNDENKEVPDTSLERKRKYNRITAQRLKKRKENE